MLLNLPDVIPQHVGEQITLLRMRKGMSQTELAKASGLNWFTIVRIESGYTASPRPRTLLLILTALGIDAEIERTEIVEAQTITKTTIKIREPIT